MPWLKACAQHLDVHQCLKLAPLQAAKGEDGGQRQQRRERRVLSVSRALPDAESSVLVQKKVSPLKLQAPLLLCCPLKMSCFWSMASSLGQFLVSLCGTNPKPNEAK